MWAFLPETPRSMRSQERFKLFEVMAGLNKDDGSYFIRECICWPSVCMLNLQRQLTLSFTISMNILR